MDRNWYYIAIAVFGMINGLFNQALLPFGLCLRQGAGAGAAVRQRIADADVCVAHGFDRDHHRRAASRRRFTSASSAPRTIRPKPRCGSGWRAPDF